MIPQPGLVVYMSIVAIIAYLSAFAFLSRRSIGWRVVREPILFAFAFAAFTFAGLSYWKGGVDLKDPISVFLYFCIIPTVSVCLSNEKKYLNSTLYKAAKFIFGIFIVLAVVDLVRYGIDIEYGRFFFHSKNTAGMLFEVIYCYVLFNNQKRSTIKTIILIVLGMFVIVAIMSKTAIALTVVFTLGYLNKGLFIIFGSSLAIMGSAITIGLVEAGQFTTAYQRWLLWGQAVEEITASWKTVIFGNGPGTFEYVGQNIGGLYGQKGIHNYYIRLIHSYGLPVGVIFLGYLFEVWRKFGVFTSGPAAAFWVFSAHALFDVGWVIGPGLIASLMLGLLLGQRVIYEKI